MIRTLLAAAAILLAQPALSQTALPSVQKEQASNEAALAAAIEDMHAGRHDAAIARLDPLIADYERAHASEKRMIFCAGNMEETLAYMMIGAAAKKSAVAIAPSWCSALFVKGFVLVDAKRLAEGKSFNERAIAMRPGNAHYLNELAYVLQTEKQWQASYDTYAKALSFVGLSDEDLQAAQKGRALRGMGFDAIELGRWDEAEAKFKEALALDPNDAKAKSELQYIAEQRRKRT